jgi:transcriptional regulator with XRE-family HTH domain
MTGDKNFMKSRIQQLAEEFGMSYDEFVGEIRKRGCSEPTAAKIWSGAYEQYKDFKDNDINLSNLRKAADVFNVSISALLP